MSNQQNLFNYTIGLADDAMILGQRLSEWCGKAPFLEEDLALSNTALDFIGRAQMFYNYASELTASKLTTSELDTEQRSADQLAFLRTDREFTNNLIHELPIGDFAYTLTRQFFVDAFNVEFLSALTNSTDTELSAIANKAIKESHYHLRRSRDWLLRMGDGTEESHAKVQKAIDHIWPYTQELFSMTEVETQLVTCGIAVDKAELLKAWEAEVKDTLTEATLSMPDIEHFIKGGREGIHTEHLGHLLAEMQYLQRAHPNSEW